MALALSVSVPRPFMTMLAPSLARACAMPSPMPEVEPVTTAVLPSSAIAILLSGALRQPSCRKAAILPILREASPAGRALCCSHNALYWRRLPERLGDEPMTPEEKLTAMGLMLPDVPKPVGSYLPYKVSADMLCR